jgi:hypothetical protein
LNRSAETNKAFNPATKKPIKGQNHAPLGVAWLEVAARIKGQRQRHGLCQHQHGGRKAIHSQVDPQRRAPAAYRMGQRPARADGLRHIKSQPSLQRQPSDGEPRAAPRPQHEGHVAQISGSRISQTKGSKKSSRIGITR